MKKIVACVALASLFALGGTALAEIGTVDAVPAATLLIPRFEVDRTAAAGAGLNTLFSVNNASDESVVAHITVWSELWVPILDFDVYLTGYDVQTMSLADILLNGVLPRTGPSNTLSPIGLFSGPHDTFGGTCSATAGQIPNYNTIPGFFLTAVQNALSGVPSGGNCASVQGNEDLMRGYITIDSVSECSQDFPNDAVYFVDGGQGTANNQNVLWGDYFLVDPQENFAQGWTDVHIEADWNQLSAENLSCDTETGFPYTFYCTTAENAADLPGEDNREALPSVYGSRYAIGGGFDGGTDLIVWRDPGFGNTGFTAPACGAHLRLTQAQIVAFDEQEQVIVEAEGPSGFEPPEENPFPLCTNRVSAGTDIQTVGNFGWFYLNLNEGVATGPEHNQAYVQTVMSALGRFSVGYDGIAFNNLTLNADERGDRDPNPSLGQNPPTLFDGDQPIL